MRTYRLQTLLTAASDFEGKEDDQVDDTKILKKVMTFHDPSRHSMTSTTFDDL
jgi:hypothetical protein